MSDFVIRTRDGKEFGVDDVLMDPNARVVKYIARYSHQRCMMKLEDVDSIRRERWGNEGGPAFGDDERGGWSRPA